MAEVKIKSMKCFKSSLDQSFFCPSACELFLEKLAPPPYVQCSFCSTVCESDISCTAACYRKMRRERLTCSLISRGMIQVSLAIASSFIHRFCWTILRSFRPCSDWTSLLCQIVLLDLEILASKGYFQGFWPIHFATYGIWMNT